MAAAPCARPFESEIVKVEPLPTSLVTQILPPCSSRNAIRSRRSAQRTWNIASASPCCSGGQMTARPSGASPSVRSPSYPARDSASEAREAGRPLLVSTAGGLPEQVGKAGIIVNCDNEDELLGALRTLHTLPLEERVMAKLASDIVHLRFAKSAKTPTSIRRRFGCNGLCSP